MRTGSGEYAQRFLFLCARSALVAAIGLALLAGCGSEEYEQRLENTRKYYAHFEVLDANLHGEWTDQAAGVSLRVPRQFGVIPASSAPTGSLGADGGGGPQSAGGDRGAAVDERQPTYLNVELPGLRGAFAAPVKAMTISGSTADDHAFIYVLTNQGLPPDRARTFQADVVSMLSQAVNTVVDPTKDWSDPKFPQKVGTFAETVAYKLAVISPREPIQGVERRFEVYMHPEGDVQVVILCVFPKDLDPSDRLADRMPLCLETLRVTSNTLTRPAAPGGAPAKGPTVGF